MKYISKFIGLNSEVVKGYSITSEECINGSTEKLWSIYSGKRTKDNFEVSIFVLKKQKMAQRSNNTEQMITMLKNEAQTLMRLRHPNFLKILEPVYEDAKQILYITEKVETTLQLVLKNKDSLHLQDEIQLKVNLKDIIEGLQFLNKGLKTVHLNICPENIFICNDGKWKIGGCMFAQMLYDDESKGYNKIDPGLPIKPNFAYASFSHFEDINDTADIFSLTLVLYHIFAVIKQKALLLPERITNQKEAIVYLDQIIGIKKGMVLEVFPSELKNICNKILNQKPIGIYHKDLLENAWFDDPRIKILDFINVFITKSPQEQKDFICALSHYIHTFKPNLLENIIVPFLKFHVNNDQVNIYILSLLLLIIEKHLIEPKSIR